MKRKIVNKLLSVVLSLAMLVTIAGCGEQVYTKEPAQGSDAQKQAEEPDPKNGEPDEGASEKKVPIALTEADTLSMTDFAVRLFQQSLEEEENTMISPLSVISALGMTANGANGDTLAQMEQALGMGLSELNEYLYAYNESLPENTDKAKLNMANAIWLRDAESLTVQDGFLQINEEYYEAEVRKSAFDKSTVDEINGWVSDNTDGMIKNVLNQIPEDVMLYLVNALAFDAEWKDVYSEHQVREAQFTKEDGSKQDIELMYSDENVYLKDDNAVGFMKYYAGEKYAFAALLPDEGVSISDYANSLTGEKLNNILTNASQKSIDVAIPKFSSEYSINMNDALRSMGMKDAFDEDKADFSNMASSQLGNLYINAVLHKTYIEVDAQGTKAAAVTVIGMDTTSLPTEAPTRIYLDRPFVYMIVDCENNVPVFIGVLRGVE